MSKQALVYCRVSTKGQEEDGTSLESQEAACVRHAESLGYVVGRVTREVYSGAELWDRPKLAQDRADVKASQFGALVFYSLDRLSRDPVHLALIAEECERADCEMVCVTEPIDKSDEGALVTYIKGYAGKIERARIRERQLRGKYQRALQGKVHRMGPELYGWRRDKDAGVRVVYDDEARIVHDIFSRVASGQSYHAVAKHLNNLGVVAPGQSRVPDRKVLWKASTIARIIRNTAYKGEAEAWKWKRVSTRGKAYAVAMRAPEERVPLPEGVVPPIVSADLWQRAQEAVASQSGNHTRNERLPYLLRGRIFCGICGRKFYPSWERSNGHTADGSKVRTYRCASHNSPEGICGARIVRADRIEERVWQEIATRIRQPDLIAADLARREQQGPDPVLVRDLENARRKLAECETKQESLLDNFLEAAPKGSSTTLARLVEEKVAALDKEKGQWEKVIAECEKRIAQQSAARGRAADARDYCARLAPVLDRADFDTKLKTTTLLDVRVTVHDPEHWDIAGLIRFGAIDGDVVSPTS